MESLLEVPTCVRCGFPYTFHLARFGCVFRCRCGECLDALKVAVLYADRLLAGQLTPEFVPCLQAPPCALTSGLRVAQVELDFVAEKFNVRLRNFSASEAAKVACSLSLAVQEHVGPDTRAWEGPIDLLDVVSEELRAAAAFSDLRFFVNEPPPQLQRCVRLIRSTALPQALMSNIPANLVRVLRKHQLDGVRHALRLGGRILFADDMGVGKTLEAIATFAALMAYPVLIVCPSAVKFMWADQIEQHLHEHVGVDEVHIIGGANDALPHDAQPKVVLVSYHMAAVLETQLLRRRWACVVCDESHTLHTNVGGSDAVYTRAVAAIAKQAPHCLLLSGTPALNSPFDMFNQIDMLREGLLGLSRYHFAMRYCTIALTPHLRVGGCTRQAEMSSLLSTCCLIRRLKRDVLELPAKRRVVLRVADGVAAGVGRCTQRAASYQQRYASSWKTKWRGIVEAVDHCCAKYSQVVLLAHHTELIDALTQLLDRRGRAAIRIDGRVPAEQRGSLLASFHRKAVQVAVIGITACAVGISLAPAPCAVFCELPPDAAWMAQAEDRLHRPGQEGETTIFYLLGVHSELDGELFARLCRSVREVGAVVAHSDGGGLALAQAAHSVRDCLPVLPSPPFSAAESGCCTQPIDAPLQFYASKNTGRIHVRTRDSAAVYATFLWEEARECVRLRQSPLWQQLDAFLASFARHSPFQQRQIYLSQRWFPASFHWSGTPSVPPLPRTARYTTLDRLGWGTWWMVQRQGFARHAYYAPLRLMQGRFQLLCLFCHRTALKPAAPRAAPRPGGVCVVTADTDLFCSGQCRAAFYLKRSSAAIRRAVAAADRCICAHCHVDCGALSAALLAAQGRRGRVAVLQRLHPQLLQHASLAKRLVSHPEAGIVWQADHITAVAAGGGEATLENLQTLCLLCHSLKTVEDLKRIKRYKLDAASISDETLTTVDRASRLLQAVQQTTRVLRRKP